MKAILGMAAALHMGCAVALGVIQVTWNSTGQDIVNVDGTPAPATYWAQLIWTPDGSHAVVDYLTPLIPPAPYLVVAEQTLYISGAIITPIAPLLDDSLAGGFVYTRVWERPERWPCTLMYPYCVGDGQPTGNSYSGGSNPPGLSITTADPWTLNNHDPGRIIVGIPEPSTLTLFGLGALTVLRRHRSPRSARR